MENEINITPPSQPGLQPEPMILPPKPKFRLIVLLIVLGIAIAGYFASAKYLNLWPFGEKEQIISILPGQIKSLDSTWNLYTNSRLGFSIKIPKTSAVFPCEGSSIEARVKVFEDTDGVYIANDSFYPSGDKCSKTAVTLNLLKTQKSGQEPYADHWHIILRQVKNDSEINQFIKDTYFYGCYLGSKNKASQEGVFDIEIGGITTIDTTPPPGKECFINYGSSLKYYPAKEKIAQWDLGQGVTFYNSNLNVIDQYDREMNKSFEFLP